MKLIINKAICLGFALGVFAFSPVQAQSGCGDGLSCQSAKPLVAHELRSTEDAPTDFSYRASEVVSHQTQVTGDAPVTVTGRLIDTEGQAVPFVSAQVIVENNGFETPYQVSSDESGQFSLTYRASGRVSGEHWVSVIHPDSFARPRQVRFTVLPQPKIQQKVAQFSDVIFDKTLLNTGVSFNHVITESLILKNQGNESAYQPKLSLSSADGLTWGAITSQTELEQLKAGAEWPVELRFAPPASFKTEGIYTFTLSVTYGSDPNTVTKNLPIKVSVTTDEIGNYTFTIHDIYTNYSGTGGNTGVENARIRLTRSGVPVVAGAGRTDTKGQFTYRDLPVGFYDYQISADKHTTKSGEIYVRAGVTKEERILLEIPVVKVDWSVTETVIEDKYDIVVDATYETDVPQPVIVMEPAVVKLPAMKRGDVINGALKITNRGLVSLEDITPNLPQSDKYIRYTFQIDALPSKLLPMQTVYLPYKLEALRDLKLDPMDVKSFDFQQQTKPFKELLKPAIQPKGICYRTFGYSKRKTVKGDFTCANGDKSSCSSSVTYVHTGQRESFSCTGGGGDGGFYWWGGYDSGGNGGGAGDLEGGSGGGQPPGMTPCTPGTPCGSCCNGGPAGGGPGGGGPGGGGPGSLLQ